MLLRVGLVVLCLGTSLVAADLRTLRAVQADAAHAGDLWTLLQVEAWAEANRLPLRPALPGVTVLGDPVFACPVDISWVWDRGHEVIALAGTRLYHWSEQGFPLRPSTPLPFRGHLIDFTSTTDYIGLVNVTGRWVQQVAVPGRFDFAVCDATGAIRFQHPYPSMPRDTPQEMCIAEDGSALVVASRGTAAAGTDYLQRILLVNSVGVTPLSGWSAPIAVGPEASWLIARDEQNRLMLRSSAEPVLLRAAVRGPDQVAVLTEAGALAEVLSSGALRPLTLPVTPGADATLVSLGQWLVLASGTDATTAPGIDLLGNPTEGGAPVAPTLYGWRWQDLAPDAVHAAYFPGQLRVVRDQPAMTFLWQDTQIEQIDWSGDTPQIRVLNEAPAAVASVESRLHGTVATLVDGRLHVLDGHGAPVWTGTVDTLTIEHPGWAIAARTTANGIRYVGLRMARENNERREIPFDLEPGAWNVAIDPGGAWAIAWQGDGTWRRLQLPEGTVSERGDATAVMPQAGRSQDPQGRFALRGPRCYAKVDGYPNDAQSQINAIDAWRLGRTVVVLSADGTVQVSGRRPQEVIEVGRAAGGTELMQSAQGLTVVDARGTPLAVLVAGPRLVPVNETMPVPTVEVLPDGPWRVNRLRYVPPRSGNLVWNQDHGVVPHRLRNPDTEVLLVPMGAVVLVADAHAAKTLGRPLEPR